MWQKQPSHYQEFLRSLSYSIFGYLLPWIWQGWSDGVATPTCICLLHVCCSFRFLMLFSLFNIKGNLSFGCTCNNFEFKPCFRNSCLVSSDVWQIWWQTKLHLLYLFPRILSKCITDCPIVSWSHFMDEKLHTYYYFIIDRKSVV